MENELKIFKKKISARYAGRQIIDFTFPRMPEPTQFDSSSLGNVDMQRVIQAQMFSNQANRTKTGVLTENSARDTEEAPNPRA